MRRSDGELQVDFFLPSQSGDVNERVWFVLRSGVVNRVRQDKATFSVSVINFDGLAVHGVEAEVQ